MLPYESIKEAESSIGRCLTGAERLWFFYSKEMPDFWLYSHSLLFLFIVLNVASLPSLLIQASSSCSSTSSMLLNLKLQPNVRYSGAQLWQWYKTVVAIFFLVVGPMQLLSYPAIKWVGVRTGLPLPSVWEVACQLAVSFLLEDYTNYWIHRWLHSRWAYKNIHYMHHQITAPFGLATFYTHWAEVVLLGIPSSVGPAIMAPHMITLWLWVSLRQLEAIDTHSGYDLSWSLTKLIPFYGGSEFHDYHHFVGQKSYCNFASVFTYCDHLYGTFKGYKYEKYTKTKLKGNTLTAHQKVYPIENSVLERENAVFSSEKIIN